MKKIGMLFLVLALLVSTVGTQAASTRIPSGSKVGASSGAVDVAEKEPKGLSKPFINRARKLCDDLKVEHSLSFIPITLCFYLQNQEDQANSEKGQARSTQ